MTELIDIAAGSSAISKCNHHNTIRETLINNLKELEVAVKTKDLEEISVFCQYIESNIMEIHNEDLTDFFDKQLLLKLYKMFKCKDPIYMNSVLDLFIELSLKADLSFIIDFKKFHDFVVKILKSQYRAKILSLLTNLYPDLTAPQQIEVSAVVIPTLSNLPDDPEVIAACCELSYCICRKTITFLPSLIDVMANFLHKSFLNEKGSNLVNVTWAIRFFIDKNKQVTKMFLKPEFIDTIFGNLFVNDHEMIIATISLITQLVYQSDCINNFPVKRIIEIAFSENDDEATYAFDLLANILCQNTVYIYEYLKCRIIKLISYEYREYSWDRKKSAAYLFLNMLSSCVVEDRGILFKTPCFKYVLDDVLLMSPKMQIALLKSLYNYLLLGTEEVHEFCDKLIDSDVTETLDAMIESGDKKVRKLANLVLDELVG